MRMATTERNGIGQNPSGKLLLNTLQAADALNVSKSTVIRLSRAGKLPVVKIGDRPLYSPDDLKSFIDRQRVTA